MIHRQAMCYKEGSQQWSQAAGLTSPATLVGVVFGSEFKVGRNYELNMIVNATVPGPWGEWDAFCITDFNCKKRMERR
eukprot:g68225.t1